MGIVECYGWQNVSNLFSLQFCIEFSLYQLLSTLYDPLFKLYPALYSELYQLLSALLRSTLYDLPSKL